MKKVVSIAFIMILIVSCTQKYPFELGSGFKINYDGNSYFYLLDNKNTVIISSHIIRFNFDSTFIIAEQKPVDLILKETFNNPEMNLEKRKKLFRESPLRLYWIINKNEQQVYGPFNENKYLQKRKELGVSSKLILKE